MQTHPLSSPRRGQLLPPEKEFNSPGWRKYHAVAADWLNDLQNFATNERHRNGATSAGTDELLTEARDALAWAKRNFDRASLLDEDLERFVEVEAAREELEYKRHVARWRKHFERNPDSPFLRPFEKRDSSVVPGSCKNGGAGGMTERALNQIRRERTDLMTWLTADLRSEDELVNDALEEAIIEAELDELLNSV
jgi:hypothetical protein